jgi:hypothetical protein
VSKFRFDPEDMRYARDLLSRKNAPLPDEPAIEMVARAINTERRSHVPGEVTDAELRAAHDRLCDDVLRHSGASSVLESLARTMLARGLVPDTDDYDGKWWLWWPRRGRGPCQHCGKERSLTRYMARFGMPERYLCQRCRKQEIADREEYLNATPGLTREPFEDTWSTYVSNLENLLSSLAWAGWELPATYETDYDPEEGAYLFGELTRTGMLIAVQYQPSKDELLLLSCGYDEDFSRLSMLNDEVKISVGHAIDSGAAMVAERAGELGLLDATRLMASSDSDISTAELISDRVLEWILEPAAEYRDATASKLGPRFRRSRDAGCCDNGGRDGQA